jgi:transposase-like protein
VTALEQLLQEVRDVLHAQLEEMKESRAESKAAREQAMALATRSMEFAEGHVKCPDCGGDLGPAV